jgi:DNA-binding GntR family transcriptional regulator
VPNRFIDDFYDIITLIFHYHYQWNKQDERQRNEVAIHEHLTYIEALLGRSVSMVDLACRAHLSSAKQTLMSSTLGEGPELATTKRHRPGKTSRTGAQPKPVRLR